MTWRLDGRDVFVSVILKVLVPLSLHALREMRVMMPSEHLLNGSRFHRRRPAAQLLVHHRH